MLRVFVLYSHSGYSILDEKLNGQQTFESMSLLRALNFFKNNTFHNCNNYQKMIVFYLGNHLLLSLNLTFIHLHSWKHCHFICCYYLQFLTKKYCLYFQPIRLQLRRYGSGYLWNRKLWRMSIDSIQALTSTTNNQIESSWTTFSFIPHFCERSSEVSAS